MPSFGPEHRLFVRRLNSSLTTQIDRNLDENVRNHGKKNVAGLFEQGGGAHERFGSRYANRSRMNQLADGFQPPPESTNPQV